MKKLDHWVLKFLFFCLGIRILSGFIKAFLPHELPHRWRENDTYGVAVRYFLRWTVETGEDSTLLLPAVLNSGKALGITPMELPVFNVIAAPFIAGGEVWGYGLAHLAMFTICAALLYWAAYLWGKESILGVKMRIVCLVMAIFTISSAFLFKFMPDFLSFILVFIGVCVFWTRAWSLRAFFFVTLGLLIKPTSVVVLALLLVHSDPIKFAKTWLKWALPSVVITTFYFTTGVEFVRSFQDVNVHFYVDARDPVASFFQFFSEPVQLLRFLWTDLMFVPGVGLFLLLLPALAKENRHVTFKLFSILFLQTICLAVLSGDHSFMHPYYFIGTAPTIAMLLVNSYSGLMAGRLPSKIKVLILSTCLLSAFATLIEGVRTQIRSVLPVYKPALAFQSDCKVLKDRNPDWPWNQGYAFRGHGKMFAEASVCFHEREGDNESGFGIFSAHEMLPSDCEVFDQEGNAVIATCLTRND